MDTNDRRVHPRRAFDQDVMCYIDGNRLDGRTADISVGGLFLKTLKYANFQKGGLVALVFEDDGPPPGTAFLFARVVRHHESAPTGVGLHWERAVCVGSSEPLRKVLDRLFGAEPREFLRRELPDRGVIQYVHRFPAVAASSAEARPTAAAAEAPSALELDYPRSAAARPAAPASPRAALPDPEGPSADPEPRPPEAPRPRGPLSQQIDLRGARQAVDMPATLEAVGVPIGVRLRWIGPATAGVDCPWVPMDPDMPMRLTFEIPTHQGPVGLNCNVRVLASDRGKGGRVPSLDLAIRDVDEAGHTGLLVRYLKWLACRQMTKD